MQFINSLEREYDIARTNTRIAFDRGETERYWYWRGELIAVMNLLEKAQHHLTLQVLEAARQAAEVEAAIRQASQIVEAA